MPKLKAILGGPVSKREAKSILKRMAELRKLLAEFGLTLAAFDPGVHAIQRINNQSFTLTFKGVEWAWLEPLLVELRNRRKEQIP